VLIITVRFNEVFVWRHCRGWQTTRDPPSLKSQAARTVETRKRKGTSKTGSTSLNARTSSGLWLLNTPS